MMIVLPKRQLKFLVFLAAFVAAQTVATAVGAAPESAADAVVTPAKTVTDAPVTITDCLNRALTTAADSTTVGELRARCQQKAATGAPATISVGPVNGLTAVDERVVKEDASSDHDYILTTYKPNYLVATYNSNVNQEPFEDVLGESEPLNNGEVKFQLSIQAPIFRKPFGWDSDLMVAYTSTSWWQMGNEDSSNPFRETNYQPEIFLRNLQPHRILGLKISGWSLGFNHQSNGRSGDLSRSWNRLMGGVVFDLNDLALITRAWYRVEQSSATDDNPNITSYAGYGDLRAVWVPSANTYTFMYRPASKGGAVELTWSRKISKNWRIYAQYWNGYTESLIDYDFRTKRIGIGFALSDYLER